MLKSLVNFIESLEKIDGSLVDDQAIAEIAENIGSGHTDFEVVGYRFIRSNEIDDILSDELLSDLYLLGSFNASFLSNIDGFPLEFDDILALQDAGAYEAIGKIAAKFIGEIVEDYVRWDGYGHHFGSYDGNEHEIKVDGQDWFVFRVD